MNLRCRCPQREGCALRYLHKNGAARARRTVEHTIGVLGMKPMGDQVILRCGFVTEGGSRSEEEMEPLDSPGVHQVQGALRRQKGSASGARRSVEVCSRKGGRKMATVLSDNISAAALIWALQLATTCRPLITVCRIPSRCAGPDAVQSHVSVGLLSSEAPPVSPVLDSTRTARTRRLVGATT